MRHIDEGRAKLKNGFAKISLDPIFKETIENDYNVYVTPEGKTKALYVAEKAKDYFIVRDTAATNAVFSYIISAYRKGYTSKRFDSGSDIEIIATIDEESKLTDIEINGNVENKINENSKNKSSNQNNNSITGNIITEVPLQTDLSTILSNESATISNAENTTMQPTLIQNQSSTANQSTPTTNATSQSTSVIIKNNSNNASGGNATNNQTTLSVQQNAEEQKNNLTDENEKMTIKDTTYKYINQTAQTSENKFTINSMDENEIIKEIEQKTKLSKEEIKRAIKFKKKEPVKNVVEDNLGEETTKTIVQQVQQLDYMTKVNGSVIIRLG